MWTNGRAGGDGKASLGVIYRVCSSGDNVGGVEVGRWPLGCPSHTLQPFSSRSSPSLRRTGDEEEVGGAGIKRDVLLAQHPGSTSSLSLTIQLSQCQCFPPESTSLLLCEWGGR